MRKVNKDFNAPPDALQRGFEENKENLLQRKSEHQFDGRKLIEQFEALLEKQTVRFLQEKAYQRDVPSSVRLAFFVVFDLIERQLEDEQEYTLTGRCIWSNIKKILFEAVHKENQEIEALLDYALSLYLQSKGVF